MTEKQALEKLLERHKRVSARKSGPMPLGFTIPEKQAVRTLAASQHSKGTIAARAGMSRKQFDKALEADSELADAFEAGVAEERLKIEQALYKAATDVRNPRQVQACMALLKVRHGYRDNSATSATQVNVQVNNNLPAPLDPRRFAAMMKRIEKQRPPVEIEATPEPRGPNTETDPITAIREAQKESRR